MKSENSNGNILNIAAYQFLPLRKKRKLEVIRRSLKNLCLELDIKGTILLSFEGFNLNLAGKHHSILEFQKEFSQSIGIAEIKYKQSWSKTRPFTRMLVKIKKEIIPLGDKNINPLKITGKRLPPKEFKKWLDEKKEITILDTRNEFEIKIGKFKGAKSLGLKSFREFCQKSKSLPSDLKQKPMVMYCTGGIRCEKASSFFLNNLGFKNVFQLEGGILDYFEQCGDAHFEGECFVFDKRVGLDSNLKETQTCQCYNCRAVLTINEINHPQYKPPHSCPQCHPT